MYRWAHPSEWLVERLHRFAVNKDVEALHWTALELARTLDGDQIQDLFQDEMDADGYFKKRGK